MKKKSAAWEQAEVDLIKSGMNPFEAAEMIMYEMAAEEEFNNPTPSPELEMSEEEKKAWEEIAMCDRIAWKLDNNEELTEEEEALLERSKKQ